MSLLGLFGLQVQTWSKSYFLKIWHVAYYFYWKDINLSFASMRGTQDFFGLFLSCQNLCLHAVWHSSWGIQMSLGSPHSNWCYSFLAFFAWKKIKGFKEEKCSPAVASVATLMPELSCGCIILTSTWGGEVWWEVELGHGLGWWNLEVLFVDLNIRRDLRLTYMQGQV